MSSTMKSLIGAPPESLKPKHWTYKSARPSKSQKRKRDPSSPHPSAGSPPAVDVIHEPPPVECRICGEVLQSPHFSLCSAHKCGEELCAELTTGNGYCKPHSECSLASCSFLRENSPFCAIHCCQRKGCPEPSTAHGVYCENDECGHQDCHLGRQYQFDSQDGRLKLMTYCPMHTCEFRLLIDNLFRCPSPKEGRFFCNGHKCERDDCDMARDMNRNAMGMVVEGFGTFCSSHNMEEERNRLERDEGLTIAPELLRDTPITQSEGSSGGILDFLRAFE